MRAALGAGDEFQLDDVLQELQGLPGFLHEKGAQKWLCQAVALLRMSKGCGREELAFILGTDLKVFNEALPSSADAGLVGESLQDIGFLPRGAGCLVSGSRSAAYLNGRKVTLARSVTDEASHAEVLVEGSPGEAAGSEDPGKTILVARKNLEYASPPGECEAAGWPPVSLAPPPDEAAAAARLPAAEELLGGILQQPSVLPPPHLRGPEALGWLSGVVGRLAMHKLCGREELAYLLKLDGQSQALPWGSVVPPSLLADQCGSMLEELGYVPAGVLCAVEGSTSYAHLNGLSGRLQAECPDRVMHAAILLDVQGEAQPGAEAATLAATKFQIHRKNLRLVALLDEAPSSAVAAVADAEPPDQPPTVPPQDAKDDGSGALDASAAAAAAPAAPPAAAPVGENDTGAGQATGGLQAGRDAAALAAAAPGGGPLSWLLCCCAAALPAGRDTIPAPPAAPSPGALVADLRRLSELRTAGALSEEEFQAAKAQLLASRGAT